MRGFLVSLLILSTVISTVSTAQQLYINEIMASNARTVADASGSYEDWIEIYNPNPTPVNIGGYYITDNLSNPTKHQIPTGSSTTIVPANGFLILWASDVVSRGPLHIGFKLSADGESVGLYRANGTTVVDQFTFGPQRTDISWGRKPDGSSTWLFFQRTSSVNNTSPGASNNGKTGYATITPAPVFSQVGGFYNSGFNLTLTSPDPGATIYYTTDGSDPNPASLGPNSFSYKNSYVESPGQSNGPLLTETFRTFSYTGTIGISDRSSSANRVSMKASSFNNSPYYVPTSPVFKGTVIRAVAFKSNAIVSETITNTYFITPTTAKYGSLPVVSIGVNERDLFDYNTGIYTAGTTFDGWRNSNPTAESSICNLGNFSNRGDDWERPANVEFFINGTSTINQPIDIAINGGCSRSVPRKSLRLYGSDNFTYPFFGNRPADQFYDRLLLRSGGNDWNNSILIDAYMQTMVRHLNFETQSNRPSVMFINGEYWGVHTLMERYDNDYLNRNFNVHPDSVDIVKASYGTYEADNGDLTAFNQLNNYFISANPISYSYVNTLMDIQSYTDYFMSEIYSANTDWPQNNQQFWRKRTNQYLPNAPFGQDGRFRWMMNDIDYGLSGVNNFNENSLNRATLADFEFSSFTRILRRLLDLPDYRSFFINRYADLLNTTFTASRTTDLLDAFQQEYQPYMTDHFSRWNTGLSLSSWLTNVGRIRTFVQQRPAVMRDHIRGRFGLTNNQNLTVNVSDANQGYVKVNTIDILPTTAGVPTNPYPWTGIYFQGNTIRIVAKAKPGYRFVAWQENGSTVTTDTAYSYNPTSNRTFLAVFALDNAFVGKPAAYSLSNCDYRFEAWSATAPAGTYPPNMHFVTMNQADPTLAATFTLADTVKGAYNLSSSTRINGLGADGLAFINTSGTNTGYIATSLGGVLLALRTIGLTQASVQWTGGTVTSNSRQYAIRLRYRVGNAGSFQDVLNSNGQPVEYVRNDNDGHSQVIGPVALPPALLNAPYVQLLWQYYYTGPETSGPRDQLRIDNIVISRGSCRSQASGSWHTASTWSCGRVPSLCDDVVVAAGHTVTLTTAGANARSIRFEANGRIQYANASASVLLKNP